MHKFHESIGSRNAFSTGIDGNIVIYTSVALCLLQRHEPRPHLEGPSQGRQLGSGLSDVGSPGRLRHLKDHPGTQLVVYPWIAWPRT